MIELPDALKSGNIARLFPVIAETGKEQRATSILLSVMSAVPQFADALLSQLGQRVNGRTQIDTFVEVVFKNDLEPGRRDRPDGLVRVHANRREWSCLVETKIGASPLEVDQVERYLRIARDNNIDAVLTISNDFAAVSTHHPLKVQKVLTRKVGLYHLSWSEILTIAVLMHEQGQLSDREQAFIIREFVRFFSHPSAGISGFTSMPKEWGECVAKLQAGGGISKAEGEAIVRAWHQEAHDLSLILSRIISCNVSVKLPRAHIQDQEVRATDDIKLLCDKGILNVEFVVPNTASPIQVVADLNARSFRISMVVDAPKDKVRTRSRVAWMLRQLKDVAHDNVYVGVVWSSRAPKIVLSLTDIRANPEQVEQGNVGSELRAFEITLTSSSARRFSGTRTFIEELEILAPQFYEVVGQHLESWKPSPPKPRHSIMNDKSDDVLVEVSVVESPVEINEALPEPGNAHGDLLEIPAFLARSTSPILSDA